MSSNPLNDNATVTSSIYIDNRSQSIELFIHIITNILEYKIWNSAMWEDIEITSSDTFIYKRGVLFPSYEYKIIVDRDNNEIRIDGITPVSQSLIYKWHFITNENRYIVKIFLYQGSNSVQLYISKRIASYTNGYYLKLNKHVNAIVDRYKEKESNQM